MEIKSVMQAIGDLFKTFNKDAHKFTVDYDEKTDSLYCHYTPCVNDCGFAVSDDLLCVCDTSKEDLRLLKEFLDKNGIKSRYGCEWSVDWGWRE